MNNNNGESAGYFKHVDCEVRDDALTRALFATDASLYQLEPRAVAFPKTPEQAAAVLRAALDLSMPVTARGAGTGLAGGALGDGLIIDMARHTRWIADLDRERRTVRVGPGVVLDQLNDFLKPHGLCFGPDVATSSRATLGGMINNNSSGARAPLYGTTADHVVALDLILADGTFTRVGSAYGDSQPNVVAVDRLIEAHESTIRARFHDGLVKRWPGYGLDRYLKRRGDLTRIISGSEGTLALMTAAELQLVPLPKEKGLAVIFFESVDAAMRATVDLLDLKPAAIEHIDRLLFDRTRDQRAFQPARAFLKLDELPSEAFLIVEFYDDVKDRLAEVVRRNIGLRTIVCASAAEMNTVWNLRKAGLSLLTSMKGDSKPVEGLEDVCVRPDQLPDYVTAVEKIARALKLEASFYGHAASGLLHVRPVVDLHRSEGVAVYRRFAEEVFAVTKMFNGSHSGEHGVGMSRAEFMTDLIGPELLHLMRHIKTLFDPRGLLNPGKVFPDRDYRIDTNLREIPDQPVKLPFEPVLGFVSRDESFLGNLEQCNGCGGCRKDTPTMCPTFIATGEEIMCTRGRANTIRAAMEHRLTGEYAREWASDALDEAIGNCLSCKACKTECPSNVDLSLLKAELLYAKQREEGVKLLERTVSRFDLLGKLGCILPGIANAMLQTSIVRRAMEMTLGLAADRPLPAYTSERFDHWFAKRGAKGSASKRGRVLLWDDCSVRYYEPEIGKAAVRVLEAAGYEVILPKGSKCCGRPAFSVGRLDVARKFGLHNVNLLSGYPDDVAIVFLEPSCHSMFISDYEELKIPNAARIRSRCFLFEQFVFDLLEREPGALRFAKNDNAIAIHGHCHAKALTDVSVMPKLASRIPGTRAEMLDSACCGMAGSFGALRKKYALSLAVAKPLIDTINALPPGTRLVASGTSCRQQVRHLAHIQPLHMAQVLADALA